MNVLLGKIQRGEYPMIRHISDQAKDIISRMLVVDPKKRMKMHEIIEHPWFAVNWDSSRLKDGMRQ